MLIDFLKSLNWVDLVMLVILIRVVYVGTQAGVVVEMFRFLGLLVTVFVCFHYFAPLAQFFMRVTKAPWLNVMEMLSFVILWGVMSFICKLIRDGLLLVFTIDTHSLIDKWGGVVLGIARFCVVGSMTLFLLLIPGEKYLMARTVEAFSTKHILPVAPNFYSVVSDGLVSRVFPDERPNKAVREQLKKVEPR